MSTYTEHEQRTLDQASSRALDRARRGSPLVTRADFTTPPHAPQFMGWFAVLASCAPAEARLRRIWTVEPRAVAPRCWRWLTTP